MVTVLIFAAFVVAGIAQVLARGRDITAWAVILLAGAELIAQTGIL